MSVGSSRPRLLLVGGGGGLVGRSVLPAFLPGWTVRSVHRNRVDAESGPNVERVAVDVASVRDWGPLLDGVDCVLTLAWYRWERAEAFRSLAEGLRRCLAASVERRVPRFLHVSVPDGPAGLERELPYFVEKRGFDRALAESGLSYRILRPTLLFGEGDRLLGPMMRLMQRYRRFPIFGDGGYHVSPLATADLADILLREATRSEVGTVDLGGPVRFTYRELTDRLFAAVGRAPRYFHLSRRGALALTRMMVALGSRLLYPYEVEWLMSDRLGLPAYAGLGRELRPLAPYLESAARQLRRARPP
jgi:NADH dehydrogenase